MTDVDVRLRAVLVVDGNLRAACGAAVVVLLALGHVADDVVAGVVFHGGLPRELAVESRVGGIAGDGAAHVLQHDDLARILRIQTCGNHQQTRHDDGDKAEARAVAAGGKGDGDHADSDEQEDDCDDEPDHDVSFLWFSRVGSPPLSWISRNY